MCSPLSPGSGGPKPPLGVSPLVWWSRKRGGMLSFGVTSFMRPCELPEPLLGPRGTWLRAALSPQAGELCLTKVVTLFPGLP